jgi:hypothetical protein
MKHKETSSTGLRGVSYKKDKLKYKAYIVKNYRQHHLGYFDSAEQAHQAYLAAAKNMFGNYFNLKKMSSRYLKNDHHYEA